MIAKAQQFAHDAHDSIQQHRKYTHEPYWVHTDAVAATVEKYGGTEEMICAAHLHDVIEDIWPINPAYSLSRIEDTFGGKVKDLVIELTDIYTKESHPTLNRKERKKLELERLIKASPEAKTIKLADLINNTESIVAHDKDFARVYLMEKKALLGPLADGSRELLQIASAQLLRSFQELGMEMPMFRS